MTLCSVAETHLPHLRRDCIRLRMELGKSRIAEAGQPVGSSCHVEDP